MPLFVGLKKGDGHPEPPPCTILAFGVYISFRILDIPDLSVDGTFITGCGTAAIFTSNGHPILGIFAAAFAGALAGALTGFLQTKCKIQPILSGILVMSGLYSINYKIMGNTPNISLFDKETIFTRFTALSDSKLMNLFLCILIVAVTAILLYKSLSVII